MNNDLQILYQIIDALTKRVETLESKPSMNDRSTQSETVKLSLGNNLLMQPAITLSANESKFKCEEELTSTDSKCNLDSTKFKKEPITSIADCNSPIKNNKIEVTTQNTSISIEDSKDPSKILMDTPASQSIIIPTKEIKLLDSNRLLSKTYSNLIGISHVNKATDENSLIANKQSTFDLFNKSENMPFKIDSERQEGRGEEATESLNKLNQFKKRGLQDMATNKISKMIKNHTILKESINTPVNITNKVKISLDCSQTMLPIGKCNLSKNAIDNIPKSTTVLCLNSSMMKPNSSLTTRKPLHIKEYDTMSTYKIERERITREKEMAINRREKTREISLRNRKQAAQNKGKAISKSKSKAQSIHSISE